MNLRVRRRGKDERRPGENGVYEININECAFKGECA